MTRVLFIVHRCALFTLFELDTNILKIWWFLTNTDISSFPVLKTGPARWEWDWGTTAVCLSGLACPFVCLLAFCCAASAPDDNSLQPLCCSCYSYDTSGSRGVPSQGRGPQVCRGQQGLLLVEASGRTHFLGLSSSGDRFLPSFS